MRRFWWLESISCGKVLAIGRSLIPEEVAFGGARLLLVVDRVSVVYMTTKVLPNSCAFNQYAYR